ncbi:MAG: 5-formyltetrahydrofolate cyclo-ligase (EC 6.3.3.2) [Olavius algarvensis Gamma 1 endosymbiont]|nr:MAG: 5-formyltetrahydrofolate cyclo-ligase (EC 6.3.3.2) [Olavius algarvensis Gamma 1 endosymbiont]
MIPASILRRRLRAARSALSPTEQRNHARALARSLGKQAIFLRAHRIGIYWSTNGEIDPFPLLRLAHARHKRGFLPVLRPYPRGKLWFLPHQLGEPLVNNRFGIPEPRLRNRRIRLPWALDLLLIPLVGFDAAGNRLGMGGGYYDRTLAYLRRHRRWRRPRLIGIAHECQRVEALTPNPWDMPLDLVVTETRIYMRRGRTPGGQGSRMIIPVETSGWPGQG